MFTKVLEVVKMKVDKMFSLAMIILVIFSLVYHGNAYFDINGIGYNVMESIFSFIFPACIFNLAWLISYKRKKNKENNNINYYKELLINGVLPYFLCMVPYIVYKYGIHNLSYIEVLKILFKGDIIIEFSYLKILIHVLALLPVAEYFVKKDVEKCFKISLGISVIFNLFKLDIYFLTKALNYLIYLTFGISFAYCSKEVLYFFRKKSEDLVFDIMFAMLLVYLTRIPNLYRFFYPGVEICYNITCILILTYFVYRTKTYFFANGKYLYDSKFFSPPIIGVSLILILKLLGKLILNLLNYTLNKFELLYLGIPVILLAISVIKIKKESILCLGRPRKQFKNINPYFAD